MPEIETGTLRSSSWWRRVARWAIVWAAIIAALALSLHRRANPWQLILTVPSGLIENDYAGYWFYELQGAPADISPDGRTLAVGRPNGQCELWDLRLLQKIGVVGDVLPPSNNGTAPGIDGVDVVRWIADSRQFAIRRRGHWKIVATDRDQVPSTPQLPQWVSELTPSPIAGQLATAELKRVSLVDSVTGAELREWDLKYVNGGNRRLDWSSDGHWLLLNDFLGLRVWDVRAGKLQFFHHELDLSLPPPMIADSNSGIEAFDRLKMKQPATLPTTQQSKNAPEMLMTNSGTSNFAVLVDSQFARDGSYIATLYRNDMLGGTNPQANRVRFYDTVTGTLLWDAVLPAAAKAMAFSPDGQRLIVSLGGWGGTASVIAYDTTGRRQMTPITSRPDGFQQNNLTILPGSRWAAEYPGGLWLVDLKGECASIRLKSAPNTKRVLATPDGRRLVDIGGETTVRVYEKRREPSRAGAFALPETWGIYVASMVLMFGIVIFAGRNAARVRSRAFPPALRAAIVLATTAVAMNIADRAIGFGTAFVYDAPEKASFESVTLSWGILLLSVAAVIGIARLKRGWWLFQLVVIGIVILIICVTAILWARTSPAFWDALAVAPFNWHGLPIHLTPAIAASIAIITLVWLILEAWLLLRPTVRDCFPPPPQRYREGPRGFPLDHVGGRL